MSRSMKPNACVPNDTGGKAQVLQWVAHDLGTHSPGIETTPGVCGGEPCVVRTRIPVWVLVQARELGTDEASFSPAYPALPAEDLANAWARAAPMPKR